MEFEFTESGLNSLKKLDNSTAKNILKKIKYWESADNPLKFAIPLKDRQGYFRFKVAKNWRVIVAVNYKASRLEILEIGHRSSIYE
ncbi:type II toxin-antitoxin system RelE/ParE family toxin [Patescibacteria group bacterium]|nr:type II toxin-antitoxin system RelE/ParE family toxin [Patescibacteria group bacterium]MBU1016480.1 type II toxin-antitoxin system RelE/ParE family toxin [Patescibacteria group bacterium]MBU1684975.1 type II toxin-antitoxin system RelE/ParE family toxin [Patescibacteria group bacterium]MBU1938326.1 type II toxin-antitoxin system RelE/ParE family toxin [Patescibacteria group bacterium]